jgi:hypothetical protein
MNKTKWRENRVGGKTEMAKKPRWRENRDGGKIEMAENWDGGKKCWWLKYKTCGKNKRVKNKWQGNQKEA